jgi:hypothetical protein
MIIDDARFGPIGKTTRRSKDVTFKVRNLIKNGRINWNRNHAHKYFGDPLHQVPKEVIVWYRMSEEELTRASVPFPEMTNNRTIHIILP